MTTAAEKLLNRCVEQFDTAMEMNDMAAAQRLLDRGERLMNFIENNLETERQTIKETGNHE